MNNYFDRSAIKERAKAALRKCYWISLAVGVLVSLALGQLPVTNFNIDLSGLRGGEAESFDSYSPFVQQAPWMEGTDGLPEVMSVAVLFFLLFILTIVLATTLVKSFFLDGVVNMGSARFFLGVTRGEAKFADVFSGFKHNYFNVSKVLFLRTLRLLLWELFLFIPAVAALFGAVISSAGLEFAGAIIALVSFFGIFPAMIPFIVKYYEYSMIPYLLAEYPDMTAEEAFAASKALTDGHKGELFGLEFSFIGWQLLGALSFGVGSVFLEPYIKTSWAEAYAVLCRLKYPPAPTPFAPIVPTTPVVEIEEIPTVTYESQREE